MKLGHLTYAVLAAATYVLSGCDSLISMSGEDGEFVNSEQAAASSENENNEEEPEDKDIAALPEEDDVPSSAGSKSPALEGVDPVLAKCLVAWKDHPFEDLSRVKTITPSAAAGSFSSMIQVRERSAKPTLYLVEPPTHVAGFAQYELQDPNGWFCLDRGMKVGEMSNLTIHCNARVADNSETYSKTAPGMFLSATMNVMNMQTPGDECVRKFNGPVQ